MKKEIYLDKFSMPIVIESYRKSKSIKIFCKDTYIKVTKPIWYSNKNIINYLDDNSKEINLSFEKNKLKINNERNIVFSHILYLGKKYEICTILNCNQENIFFKDDKLIVYTMNNYIENQELKRKVKDFLFLSSKKVIENRLKYVSNLTNIKYTTYRIKDCKTMWGSCSSKKNLNFNYRLIMFPENIIDQIVLHELCHLKYLNHSENFWNLVYKYCTKENYSIGERWIKDNIQLLNII